MIVGATREDGWFSSHVSSSVFSAFVFRSFVRSSVVSFYTCYINVFAHEAFQ